MGADRQRDRNDQNPKTRPGVTGFEQEYNQEPPPSQDLNPDAVTEDSVLPTPQKSRETDEPVRAPKAKGVRKSRRT
jgi:hypothetical protein